MTTAAALGGMRVLVVEDEGLIAMDLAATLRRAGCTVVGPARRVAHALRHVADDAPDAAILDVNLAGEPIYPVAEALTERNLPFVFSTGYGSAGIKEPFRGRPVVQKPFSQQDLKRTLLEVAPQR